MRTHLWFSFLSSAALALLACSADSVRAGSFFGPSCYGSDYAYQYPNRAHNYFGCGPDSQCEARHPLFKHRWQRKHQGTQANGAVPNGMQPNMTQPNMMQPNMMQPNMLPANAMPVEYMQAPVVQAPVEQAPVAQAPVVTGQHCAKCGMTAEVKQAPVVQAPVVTAPIHTTSVAPAPVPATPAVQSRIVPVPAPLPSGPANPESPVVNQGKPPF